ncbi:hypothetical protein Tco_0472143 [Tanacetum coccineum]
MNVAQNINNSTLRSILHNEKLAGSNFSNWHRNLRIVLRYEKKLRFVEQPMPQAPDPEAADPEAFDAYYKLLNTKQEVAFKAFHACKQEDGQSASSYLLKMKSYLDTLERLGFLMPNELRVSLILNYLNKDYEQFIQNYNMHSIGKMFDELAMLKLHEKSIPKKAATPTVLAIRGVGHWRRNCHAYNAELKKKRNAGEASTSGNGMRATVEDIKSFDLILPNGLVIVLDNYHYAPSITRGVVFVYRLVENGYMHTFLNYGISVMKDGVFYFNAIPRDGIYEIDMQNLYPNVSSIYNVSNKRAKCALDSTYL